MKNDPTKLEWVAVNGSIRTKDEFRVKPDLGRAYHAPIWIAFNVGELAEHIVQEHNKSLRPHISINVECDECMGSGLLEAEPDVESWMNLNSRARWEMDGKISGQPAKQRSEVTLVAFICTRCYGNGFLTKLIRQRTERATLKPLAFDRVYTTYADAANRTETFVPFNEFNIPGSKWEITRG